MKTKTETPTITHRDQLTVQYLPLVRAIAVRIHEKLPVHLELDDLIHAGILGLMDAATKFDAEKDVQFAAYAKFRIRGAILDSLRELDWASREMRRRQRQIQTASTELAAELHRQPSDEELAARVGIDTARCRQLLAEAHNSTVISATSTKEENAHDWEAVEATERQPDALCAQSEMRRALGMAMSGLPVRYQKVIVLYYTNDRTMKEIAMELGINESRVSQIHKAALAKMGTALESAGIRSLEAF